MDDIDRTLLDLVQRDGRGAYARYGDTVGLSAAAVHDRLKKLIGSGVIRNWSAVIDPVQAALPALAFVRVQIDLPANAKAFSEAVSGVREVLECHHISGEWSCLLKLRATSPQAVEDAVARHIASQPGVIRLQSETVTATGKETHVVSLMGAR